MSTRQNTMVGADASMPFTNSGPNPHANTASATANSGRLLRRCCTVMPGTLHLGPSPLRLLTGPSDSRLRSRHDRDPAGTRVYGIQLPIQSKSKTFVADWELSATPADLARVTQTADEHGYFYVAVCDHIAIPESLGSTMGTYWQDCITTLSWLGAQTERTALLSHAYVLPYRHPLVAAKEFATLDYLTGGRAIVGIGAGHVEAEFEVLGVDHARRGKLVEEKLPLLIEALEHEWVNGLGATPRPVQTPRPPVWIAGSSPAAIRRAATYGDGWLPQGPSNAEMVAKLQAHARRARARRPADDDRRHHAVPLRRARRAGTSARARSAARRATSPSRSWPTPPRA